VEGYNLFSAVAGESYCAAIGVGSGLAVDWLCNSESAGRGTIEDPTFWINFAFRHTDGTEHGIVELLRKSNVVRADKDMREHFRPSPSALQ